MFSQGVYLVRKEICASSSSSNHDRNDEAELLFLLGSLRHENIIELLAAYTKDGIPNLLFAPAELDLHDFLLQPNRPPGFEDDIPVLKALHGLSSAVAYLHNFRSRPHISDNVPPISLNGCHHDIKPRNILVRGVNFILADFGLSKLKDQGESTKTLWKDSTFEYGAPECRDWESFAPGKIGRSFDIWSLACVISEVVAYIEAGSQGVHDFRLSRLIKHEYGLTRCFHNGTRLSSNVNDFLDGIERQTQSLITRNLLYITRKMFIEHAGNRPTAEEVEKNLAYVLIEALSYALHSAIGNSIENASSAVDTHLFRTRLALEDNRLSAWESVLGVKSGSNRPEAHQQQALSLFPQFVQILQTTIEQVTTENRFGYVQDNHDFVLITLHNANRALCDLLSDDLKAAVDASFSVLSTLTTDVQSLQRIESTTMDENPLYQDIGMIAAMKYMSILLSQTSSDNSRYPSIDAAMIREDAKRDDPDIRPQTYHYSYGYLPGEEKKVIVEWKSYGTRWNKDVNHERFQEIGAQIFQQIQGLVAILKYEPKPPDFRVLNCLGACHDTRRHEFGIVYEFPSDTDLPVRLHKLLQHKASQEICPDPSQKLALAKALAASIQSFHISGWIHKNINSFNILFFPPTPNGWAKIDLSYPYIIGFHHSRKDGLNEYTEGLDDSSSQQAEYQHPRYRKSSSSYHKFYDYYSLGLVLLEIGTWSSLSNIYDIYPTHTPEMLRNEYIKCCEIELRIFMGPTYSELTKKCLEFDMEVNQHDSSRHLDFQKGVIDKLRSCRY